MTSPFGGAAAATQHGERFVYRAVLIRPCVWPVDGVVVPDDEPRAFCSTDIPRR